MLALVPIIDQPNDRARRGARACWRSAPDTLPLVGTALLFKLMSVLDGVGWRNCEGDAERVENRSAARHRRRLSLTMCRPCGECMGRARPDDQGCRVRFDTAPLPLSDSARS
jgi:hypothetical protein